MTICKAREYDFLDFRNEKFNTDFVDFNRKVVSYQENGKINQDQENHPRPRINQDSYLQKTENHKQIGNTHIISQFYFC